MKSAKKSKPMAISRVPQSRQDAIWAVGRVGTLRRAILAQKAQADEAIRLIGERFETDTAMMAEELAEHERGVQAWCEANRMILTNNDKVKFHDFGTGTVRWRSLPASVSIRGAEAVLEALKSLGLKAFIREKEEINKEAMLNDPDTARKVAGVTIKSEGEVFAIEPVELEISTVQAGNA
ncbi:host-nuclease inhibitor Gam family protein [Rhizobium pusense]|uniref:host-nuclease inhibitor Gam family protein n=1 Tax=Agrobacterium pusense TaxID=648995 RepID=UPI00244A2DE2|nr:host-nuclease inhibitor Gam family protein [Agrobacterium pusense]MDH1094701.1 host-nuclease inhibitor Gam family protein [Agrobacterium pusense]MDH1111374.1 host-nuclease inhibitor Gam family protein [Agrobacterium pusense]MDH2192681.1 host-nuclease inhibitor Gam family protein [Agrobacterium pusense]